MRTSYLLSLALGARAANYAVRRDAAELRDGYDFVIAGGGTCGLTVADRLSEAFPGKTVLVIEYGDIEYAPGVFDPPVTSFTQGGGLASSWILSSTPSPDINNRTALFIVGKVVGGSSAVNGMFFDRGSRHDYDAWDQMQTENQTPAFRWNWDTIFPFFKKSVTFTPPTPAVAAELGFTWDTSAYGNSTPIYASFPNFLWADHHVARKAWEDAGVRVSKECNGGDKDGLCWVPESMHPVTGRRSYSRLGHYDAARRPNYDLLVKHQVVRVVYPENDATSAVPLVEFLSLENNTTLSNITARAEVILSARAIFTPTILQRSGIGPTDFLRSAGIPVVLDLPGVGSNLQDHSGPPVTWAYTKPTSFYPMPSDMLNATFAAQAAAAFDAVPAAGPYTLAMSNSAIFIPLRNITTSHQKIVAKILAAAANISSAASHLPAAYRSSPKMIAGYQRQLSVLASLLSNPRVPSLETPFATGTSFNDITLHPLSRGTVRIDTSSPTNAVSSLPIADYRTASNPIDMDLHLAHVRFLRSLLTTPTMLELGAVETAPGLDVQTDEQLTEYIRNATVGSYMHPCCTSAMIPEDLGGVVGTDLRVHGARGLRVVDMGVLPFLPSSHLSATAYAVAEKAADIIMKQWS